jgi:hypothetical protein
MNRFLLSNILAGWQPGFLPDEPRSPSVGSSHDTASSMGDHNVLLEDLNSRIASLNRLATRQRP